MEQHQCIRILAALGGGILVVSDLERHISISVGICNHGLLQSLTAIFVRKQVPREITRLRVGADENI